MTTTAPATHTATIDIMQPGSAMLMIDNGAFTAHVWRGESGDYVMTIQGDDVGRYASYRSALIALATDSGISGSITVEQTNEATGNVMNYVVNV